MGFFVLKLLNMNTLKFSPSFNPWGLNATPIIENTNNSQSPVNVLDHRELQSNSKRFEIFQSWYDKLSKASHLKQSIVHALGSL